MTEEVGERSEPFFYFPPGGGGRRRFAAGWGVKRLRLKGLPFARDALTPHLPLRGDLPLKHWYAHKF